jgi:hypothetical protein
MVRFADKTLRALPEGGRFAAASLCLINPLV